MQSMDVVRKMGEWYANHVLRKLVLKFHDTIYMERFIMKNPLYRHMSWEHRLSRENARNVLGMVARAKPGVLLTPRGLFIPKRYLDEYQNRAIGTLDLRRHDPGAAKTDFD